MYPKLVQTINQTQRGQFSWLPRAAIVEAADFSAYLQTNGSWSPSSQVAFCPIWLHELHTVTGLPEELGPEWLPVCLRYCGWLPVLLLHGFTLGYVTQDIWVEIFLLYIQCLFGKPREKGVKQLYSNSYIVMDSFVRVYLKNTILIMFIAWQTMKVWHALLSLPWVMELLRAWTILYSSFYFSKSIYHIFEGTS